MTDLQLTLQRLPMPPSAGYTIGRLYADTVYVSDTIEDKDRGLKDKWTLAEIKAKKVYGETAVPKGRYRVTLTPSPKFRTRVWARKYAGLVPLLEGVKGFDGVRIHPANLASELLGCIAPGTNSVKGAVTQSQAAYYKLMDGWLMPAHRQGRKIYITIQ